MLSFEGISLQLKRWGKHLLLALATRKPMPRSLARLLLRLMKVSLDVEEAEQGISICRYKYGPRAAFCVSVDFDHPVKAPEEAQLNRLGTLAALGVAEKYNMPMSWLMCGSVVLKEPESFKSILRSKVPHDIGAHTFSHRNLSDPSCTEEEARLEVLNCIEVLKGVRRPKTFAFPWNCEDYHHVLAKEGFIAYRCRERKIGYPRYEHGLWEISPVYYLDGKSYGAVGVIKRLIDVAVAYGGVFHLWFHPWSLSKDGDVGRYERGVLEPIFAYVDQLRRKNSLWVCTMRELANYCETRMNARMLEYSESLEGLKFSIECKIEDSRFDFPPSVTLQIPINNPNNPLQMVGEGMGKEDHYYIAKNNGSTYLIITLAFEKPVKKVRLSFAQPQELLPVSESA